MTGCKRLETQKEKRCSRFKALPRRFPFSKTDWGFYSSRRSWSASDRLDSLLCSVLPARPHSPQSARGSREGRMERGLPLLCAALALALAPASAFRNGKWQAEARVTAPARDSLAAGSGWGLPSRSAKIHAALPGWTWSSHFPGKGNFYPGREIRN